MKRIYTFMAMMALAAVSMAQYHVIPWPNAGMNPGDLNKDVEYPPGGGISPGWASLVTGPSTAWTANQNVPFTFEFNGQVVSSYKVSPSGVLTFKTDATENPTSSNAALPSASIPDMSICIWGMAINAGDHVVSKTFGSAPNRQHWVMFNSATQAGLRSGWAYWSIVLEETTNKIYIVDQRNLCVNNNQACNGTTTLTAGVQIDGTTAISVDGSPALANLSGNSETPADNSYYEIIPGAQPANNVAAVSIPLDPNLVISDGPFDITLNMRNLGSAPLTSVKMYYSINNGTPEEANLTGLNIAPLAEGSITHTVQWSPTTEGQYNIRVWLEDPNGSADADASNNVATYTTSAWENVLQRKPLYEVFSSSTCGPCRPGNVNMDNVLGPFAGDHVTIKYQQNFPGTGDPYATAETVNRRSYYAINSIPRLEIDGQWDRNASQLTAGIHNQFKVIPAFVGIDAKVDFWATSAKIDVEIDPIADFPGNNILQVVIMEESTFFNAKTNGETEFGNVVKKMIPNQNGTAIGPLTKGQKKNFSFTHTFYGDYRLPVNGQPAEHINHNTEHSVEDFDNLIVAVWVQAPDKKVLQSDYAEEILLSTPDALSFDANVAVYPNPATDRVNVEVRLQESAQVNTRLINTLGQELLTNSTYTDNNGHAKMGIDVSGIPAGIYFVEVEANGKRSSKQLSITH